MFCWKIERERRIKDRTTVVVLHNTAYDRRFLIFSLSGSRLVHNFATLWVSVTLTDSLMREFSNHTDRQQGSQSVLRSTQCYAAVVLRFVVRIIIISFSITNTTENSRETTKHEKLKCRFSRSFCVQLLVLQQQLQHEKKQIQVRTMVVVVCVYKAATAAAQHEADSAVSFTKKKKESINKTQNRDRQTGDGTRLF